MCAFNPGSLTELPFGLPGRIYRSPMPFRAGDEEGKLFASYRQVGIEVVVILTPAEEYLRYAGRDLADFYRQQGLEVIHFPVGDFSVPDVRAWQAIVEQAAAQAKSGRAIAVHCNAGIGRTGILMACLAVRLLGLPAKQAVYWVRQSVPGALENEAQVDFIERFSEEFNHQDTETPRFFFMPW